MLYNQFETIIRGETTENTINNISLSFKKENGTSKIKVYCNLATVEINCNMNREYYLKYLDSNVEYLVHKLESNNMKETIKSILLDFVQMNKQKHINIFKISIECNNYNYYKEEFEFFTDLFVYCKFTEMLYKGIYLIIKQGTLTYKYYNNFILVYNTETFNITKHDYIPLEYTEDVDFKGILRELTKLYCIHKYK